MQEKIAKYIVHEYGEEVWNLIEDLHEFDPLPDKEKHKTTALYCIEELFRNGRLIVKGKL